MGTQRVYKTAEEALRNKPPDERDRFRLYEVWKPASPEETRYVWERNPDMAAARGSRDMGITAEPYGPRLPPEDVLAAWSRLAPAEQRRLLQAMRQAEQETEDE